MGKYLKLFNTHTEYEAFIEGGEITLPNVSHCIDINDVHYNPLATFMFLSGSMEIVTIPFTEEITSETFKYNIPKNNLYCGFISTPVSIFDTEGKTKVEIDSMFDEYSRAKISKSIVDLGVSNVYKVITFEKDKYVTNAIYNREGSIINLLFCMPNTIFRRVGVIIDGTETQINGNFASSYQLEIDGVSKSYTTSDLFGVDDAYLCVVNISSSVTVGETYAFRGFYTTYDNITITSDNILWEGEIT